jgi:hypothetical protein
LEGFRKILKLLLAEDKELTGEILRTMKHFLDVQNGKEPAAVLSDDPSRRIQQKYFSGMCNCCCVENLIFLQEFLKGGIGSVISDVTKLLVSELPKVFSKGELLEKPNNEADSDNTRNLDEYHSDSESEGKG